MHAAIPSGRAVYGVGLLPLACWDRGFQSHGVGGDRCLSVVSVVYCQIVVSATSWSLVQRSPIDFGGSLCVIKKNKPREWGGQDPLGGYRAKEKKRIHDYIIYCTVNMLWILTSWYVIYSYLELLMNMSYFWAWNNLSWVFMALTANRGFKWRSHS